MRIVFDSYAWIEYFQGTKKGEVVETYLSEEVYTPSVILLELSCRFARSGTSFSQLLKFITSHSIITNFDDALILTVGSTYAEHRFKGVKDISLPDSVVLATARKIGAKVLTGDKHFRNVEEVILL